jgi:branched-chain amino acid transport system ATP-binding protein
MALLDVSDLHAGYGRAEVLTGLSFAVQEKQVVSVIGPNGAGKSTTLAALMGMLPSRGRIVFDGQDLARATLEDHRLPYGWIPQIERPDEKAVVPPELGQYRLP